MSPELWAAIVGQTVVLLFAIVGFALRGERRITQCEGKIESLEDAVKPIRGISRALAHLQGQHEGK